MTWSRLGERREGGSSFHPLSSSPLLCLVSWFLGLFGGIGLKKKGEVCATAEIKSMAFCRATRDSAAHEGPGHEEGNARTRPLIYSFSLGSEEYEAARMRLRGCPTVWKHMRAREFKSRAQQGGFASRRDASRKAMMTCQ